MSWETLPTSLIPSNWCRISVINSMNHMMHGTWEENIPPSHHTKTSEWGPPQALVQLQISTILKYFESLASLKTACRCRKWQHDMFFQAGFGGKWHSCCLFCFRSSQVSHRLVLLRFLSDFQDAEDSTWLVSGVPFRKGAWVIPSKKLTYHTFGKRKIIFKSTFLRGYVSSQEGSVNLLF